MEAAPHPLGHIGPRLTRLRQLLTTGQIRPFDGFYRYCSMCPSWSSSGLATGSAAVPVRWYLPVSCAAQKLMSHPAQQAAQQWAATARACVAWLGVATACAALRVCALPGTDVAQHGGQSKACRTILTMSAWGVNIFAPSQSVRTCDVRNNGRIPCGQEVNPRPATRDTPCDRPCATPEAERPAIPRGRTAAWLGCAEATQPHNLLLPVTCHL